MGHRHRAGSEPSQPALTHNRGKACAVLSNTAATSQLWPITRKFHKTKIYFPSHASHTSSIRWPHVSHGYHVGQRRQRPFLSSQKILLNSPGRGKCFFSLCLARVWAAYGSSIEKQFFSQEIPRSVVEAPKGAKQFSLHRTPSSGHERDDPCMEITYTSQTPPKICQGSWIREMKPMRKQQGRNSLHPVPSLHTESVQARKRARSQGPPLGNPDVGKCTG